MSLIHKLFHGNFFIPALGEHETLMRRRSFVPSRRYQGNKKIFFQGCQYVASDITIAPTVYKARVCDEANTHSFPHVQKLRKFPKDQLYGKVVMVRFDSCILPDSDMDIQSPYVFNALSTIKYLHNAGAKLILVSSWSVKKNSNHLSVQIVAEFLSAALKLNVKPAKFCPDDGNDDIVLLDNLFSSKGELANCLEFSEGLSAGVDIFVNDAFSCSHRVLASTVGITVFCCASIAGFYFEQSLYQLQKAIAPTKRPFVAIIGGGNLSDKAASLYSLASRCDSLVLVGRMVFQIMNALGLPAPLKMLETGACEEALKLVQLIKSRNVSVVLPSDFWCQNGNTQKLQVFPADSIPDGWLPVDIGPNSLEEISSLLLNCQKSLWIGPFKFSSLTHSSWGEFQLTLLLEKLIQSNCEVTVVRNSSCNAILRMSSSLSSYNIVESASVFWDFLGGRKLHGVMALDRAYPFDIDWNDVYSNPTQPLVVDIGSGNGLFLLNMAEKEKDLNFLGLEINEKLVERCLNSIHLRGIRNGHFIATNATSTFRSLVSSYPGKLVLVSIQCPNPDFNKPEHRWRMLQKSLVESIADLLASDGKVFLQSDIEEVAIRMREQFIKNAKGTLFAASREWLKENPFGVRSDWEQHAIDRGDRMYRFMYTKNNYP
ncbi:phosphoglycerate kinase-like [Impatiens glandulifera]|uniref:phosphoglycerate kinase-like n=1 Tax=Impatiens glandulifera TaxID=253017 RepID=UPI001FB064C8|nr:phosphoglycerate kinase-like [Impatiens glandulifera]